MTTLLVPPAVIARLRAAAVRRGIAGGRDAAILHSLQTMARDLIPGQNLFADLFAGEMDAPDSIRAIGEAFWLEAGTGREARRLEGSFYTPLAVVDEVIDRIWDRVAELDASICDPALGCGFFPLRLVERLTERHGLTALRRWAAAGYLCGCDRDAAAVFLSRALLWLALSDAGGEFVPGPAMFAAGESLLGRGFGPPPAAPAPDGALDWTATFPHIAAAGGFDAMVGNPPYEVLTNFGKHPDRRELAARLRACGYYPDALRGQINLYRCFIERSLSLLRDGGELALVVPLSLARDRAAAGVRRRLLLEERAAAWRFYSERDGIFAGVTQSACIFHAVRGGGPAAVVRAATATGETELTAAEVAEFGGEGLAIPVLDGAEMALWRWLKARHPVTLGDVMEMRVGEVDQTFFRDCMRDDDTGCVLARGAHLRAFHLDTEPTPGKERFLDLDLFVRRKRGACRERAARPRVAQLGIRNMATLPRLLAACVPPGVYLGNSLNVYWPRDGVPLAFAAGLLNAGLLDWLFRLVSGNNNINLHEMVGLPYPASAPAAAMRAVEAAYAEGAARAARGEDVAAARAELDRAVAACYEVPDELITGVFGGRPGGSRG